MTHKDFKLVSQILFLDMPKRAKDMTKGEERTYLDKLSKWHETCRTFSRIFRKQYPRFDHYTFARACGSLDSVLP